MDHSGLKRYGLTDSGQIILGEQKKIKREFGKEARFFPPPFLGALWFRMPPEKTSEIRESMRKAVAAFFEFGATLEKHFSKESVEEARRILDEAAEKLETLTKKIKGKRNE